ncbi:MAG TPA: sugar phosphate isomerase/epimerase family protein [Bryobacteraceae bacterium]|nr:sugar phosphate isomerase/epimerase family protein [Bryobacteraceae bacterium]
MRIGITYLYTIFRYGYPHSVEQALAALAEICDLGFHYLEMEGLGQAHLRGMYRHRARVRRTLDELGLHVHNFCIVDPDLVHLDAGRRRKALERFRLGAEVADFLGAETLHLASYAPPVRYVEARPYQLSAKGGYRFAGATQVRIPKGFDWNRVWEALVESCRACAQEAGGKVVLMEPRVGEVICTVDSLLRLIEHVGRPNFQANFDTGHFSAQRENVPLALAKLAGHFGNIHISDNNPVDTEHLPVGEGIIDWMEFFRVLQRMNYAGYLGLDLGTRRPLVKGYRTSVKRIQEIARALRIPVEV